MDQRTNGDRDFSPENPLELSRPLLPDVEEVIPYLTDIFQRKWVTNNGHYLRAFENELSRLCGTEVSVVTNGTLALDVALRALEITGEVITTAFTFPATYHVLRSIPGITPVFVDIDDRYCLDPEAVAEAITPRTKAILAVHAYGYPCQVEALEKVAEENGLYLIFDAAPAFGVRVNDRSIARFGHISTFSFHATKVLTTLEGGAICSKESEISKQVRLMRNFGISSEEEVAPFGTNAKMDELRAAIGLLGLKRLDEALRARRRVVQAYLEYFQHLRAEDITLPWDVYDDPNLTLNYAYFPVEIHETQNFSRSIVYQAMRARGVNVRKYYHPSALEVVREPLLFRGALGNTRRAARNVLCLPVHHEMDSQSSKYVVDVFDEIYRRCH